MFCNITTVFNFHLDSSSHVEIYIFAISHHQPDFSEVTRLFSVSILEKKKKKKGYQHCVAEIKSGQFVDSQSNNKNSSDQENIEREKRWPKCGCLHSTVIYQVLVSETCRCSVNINASKMPKRVQGVLACTPWQQ